MQAFRRIVDRSKLMCIVIVYIVTRIQYNRFSSWRREIARFCYEHKGYKRFGVFDNHFSVSGRYQLFQNQLLFDMICFVTVARRDATLSPF